jgi:hypothetical protein
LLAGLVAVPSVAQRSGIFDPSTFVNSNGNLTAVAGSPWAQVLSQRLGYSVQNGESYSFAGCTTTSQCVFPNGVIPISFFRTATRTSEPKGSFASLSSGFVTGAGTWA